MANQHSDLIGDAVHPPKGFESANAGQTLIKNEADGVSWAPSTRLPECKGIANPLTGPPTEANSDVYVLSGEMSEYKSSSIEWVSGNTVRINFSSADLTLVKTGYYVRIKKSTQQRFNGSFLVTAFDTTSNYVEFTNESVISSAFDSSDPAIITFGSSFWDGGTGGDWVKFDGNSGLWQSIPADNLVECYDSSQTGEKMLVQSMGKWLDFTSKNNVGTGGSGYYSLLTDFYFTGGVATETEIIETDVDTWIDVNFTPHANGVFDYRPNEMKLQHPANPFDAVTSLFSLEGMTTKDHGAFRASMSFEPDEDNGELDARLQFERHSGTTPEAPFPIEDLVATMNQGADTDYPVEPFLTWFTGDTIDTNAPGDAGKCKFQVKSSVPGVVKMRALTWYLYKQ